MAEAIGLAASVAGLVSLGLQITGGIVTYVNALESRQDDLASVKRQNDAFAATLTIVRAAYSRFQGHQYDQTIKVNLLSCETDLHALEELLADLADCDTATWRQRVKNKTRKLTYAFHHSKVQQMLQSLQHANKGLQLVVTALGLDISGSNSDTLTRIEAASNLHASGLMLLQSEVGVVINPLTEIRNQVPLLQKEVAATADLVVSHHTITSTQLQQNHRAIQQDILRSEDSVKETLHIELTRLEHRLLGNPQPPGDYQGSAIALARRAAGTPDALRELCDSVYTLQKPQYLSATGRVCICHRTYRSSKRKTMQFGHFAFTNEQGSEGHWPSCPLSRVPAPRKRRLAVGFRYSGFASILQTMIDATFTTTFGAGGFSIGPSLTYYPLVDPKVDPAFRIFQLLKDYIIYRNCKNDYSIQLVVSGLRKLVRLFDEKKAYPTVISGCHNHSLIHDVSIMVRMVYISGHDGELLTKVFPEMIRTLLWYGVPAFTYDDIGKQAVITEAK
ncbi:hypothetical protein PG985_009947 [Apiospora marii]|uniref:uncharacterized protein n=1 Tax=Apiospora marii TaxID=335849 RepID=UPI00313037EC